MGHKVPSVSHRSPQERRNRGLLVPPLQGAAQRIGEPTPQQQYTHTDSIRLSGPLVDERRGHTIEKSDGEGKRGEREKRERESM